MEVEISWLAVVLAMVMSMIVGSVWYSKNAMGKQWGKLVGMTDEKAQKGAPKAIVITIVVSLVTAYVLAHVTYLSNQFFDNSFMAAALSTAFWMWLGFTAARMITHDVFEQRPTTLTAMNVLHELVTLMSMGLVIGWLAP